MNAVQLIGNLASDVDIRDVGDERKVASFLLAVNRPGREEADFIRISTWNRQAEVCAQFLAKGKRVAVEGRLRSRSWEDEDGNRRTAVEVVAQSIDFLTPPDRNGDQAAEVPFEAATAA